MLKISPRIISRNCELSKMLDKGVQNDAPKVLVVQSNLYKIK